MIKKIEELKNFGLLKVNTNGAIKKAKTKTQEKNILATQKSVLNNALKLYDKINIMINAFINKIIYPGDLEEDVYQDKEPEYEESIAEKTKRRRQNQEGQVLKILIPQQMLSRLLISLAQLKAGNNSEELKNEIRQLLYSLYRSKKLSKTIYEHLINAI